MKKYLLIALFVLAAIVVVFSQTQTLNKVLAAAVCAVGILIVAKSVSSPAGKTE